MEESVPTASAIISHSEKLEDESSQFYEKLAQKFAEGEELFTGFAKQGRKNKILITRTYRETITDALEACFSFKGLKLTDYTPQTAVSENISYPEALRTAVQLEEKACKFYLEAAECGKSLLATIPRAFKKVAEERNQRKLKLEALLKK